MTGLTAAQSRLWLDRRVTGREDVRRAAWDIRGEMDEDALGRAIATVAARHELPLQSTLERDDDVLHLTIDVPAECCDERSLSFLVQEISECRPDFSPASRAEARPTFAESLSCDESSIAPWSPPTRIAPELDGDDRDSAAVELRAIAPRDPVASLEAFIALIQRHTGSHRVTIGVTVPASGIGCFDPLLPMTIDDARDAAAACERLRAHAGIRFDRLLEILRPRRAAGCHPLFEIAFTIAGDRTLRFGNAEVTPVASPPPRARFDLELTIANDLAILTYRSAFWPRDWARAFLDQFAGERTPAVLVAASPPPDDALVVTTHEARTRIRRAIRPQPLTGVPAVVFSGEPPNGALIDRWRTFFPTSAPLFTMYEDACVHRIDGRFRGVAPIGRPLPGVDVRVMDDDDCAIGEVGSLIVRGQPTGDLARIRSGGEIEVLGRSDRAVWIAGVRVDPAAIERELVAIAGVRAASVAAEDSISGERKLVAHVTADADVLAALASRFPHLAIRTSAATETQNAASPRDPTELRLARMWEQLLERDDVGITDDFFLLGGDSIAALDLVARIDAEFGVALEPSVLLPDATIAHLAEVVRHASVAPSTPLVTIQRGDADPPLVCVHPSGGSILCYVDLARSLGSNHAVAGLKGPDPRSGNAPPCGAAEMASRYVAALRATHPRGPYRLAGYSFGGLIAFEMARQLGDEAALVALLDTRFPRAYGAGDRNPVVDLGEVLERYDLESDVIDEAQEHELWRELTALAARYVPAGRRRGLSSIQEFCRVYRLMPAADDLGYHDLRRFLRNLRANFRTMRDYTPSPTNSRVVLVSATRTVDGRDSDHERNADSWRSVAASLEVHAVDATHFDLMAPPAVHAVAHALEDLLP